MIHTIITDFDGTLVDTFKANLLAYQMAFHEVGMTLTEEKYKDCFGYRFECFMAAMKITNEKIANHIRETKKQYYPQYFKYLKINTPLLELIRSFRNIGNNIAIASTARKENLMNALEYLNLTNDFDYIISGKDVKKGKPDPEIYQTIMSYMNAKPEETLIFEDSLIGLEAAKRSWCILYKNNILTQYLMEIEVKGHSGCQINIIREQNELYIYKTTNDKTYLHRLIKQANKQKTATQIEYQHIRVPQVYDITHSSQQASIKMEYVYSKNFIEYFESAGFEQINYFIKALILFIEKELHSSPLQQISASIIQKKFIDVKQKINANPLLTSDAEIIEIVNRSTTVFNQLNTIEMPVGVCHGDLTFSNILFNGNNYYLIDFLDSFIEAPLLDIVKIRQDSAHLWSQLMYTKSYDQIRLQIVCEKIDCEIDQYFQRYKWYKHYYQMFQLMNMLRILQYAHEENVISYLKIQIKSLLP